MTHENDNTNQPRQEEQFAIDNSLQSKAAEPSAQLTILLPTEEEKRDIRSALVRRMAPAADVEEAWRKINSKTIQAPSPREGLGVGLWRRLLAGVAAVAACVAVVFWLWTDQEETESKTSITLLAQTTDGTDVTMTVEEGEWGEARSRGGEARVVGDRDISFEKPHADAQAMPTVILMTTPRGKDCHLTLSDGTRVWMNADSQLEFPEQFAGSRRTVRLTGEAYFEVAKDRRHPFVVETDHLTTTVLGTSFNVRAYSPSDASVVLVEGQVSVQSGRQQMTLKPGQQALLGERSLTLKNVNTYSYTQRKDGFFYFNDDTMREIMVELGRWYNKAVVFEEPLHMDMRLHFVADRTQSLPQIINSLCEMDGVDIELGSNEIIVK